MFYQGTLCREPPPLQLGTPTGPIRGRLGSWYPSIIWKNLQVCVYTHHGSLITRSGPIYTPPRTTKNHQEPQEPQLCVRVHTPPRVIIKKNRIPYYKIRVPYYKIRVPYYKIGSLICITGTSGSPSVCNTHHGSHMHTTILLQYYQGTGCTAKVQVVLQRYRLYCKGTGCTAKVQVVLQRYRLYHKVCVGSSGSYEYTHHKVCVYTHHKGNTVVLNNTNTNW